MDPRTLAGALLALVTVASPALAQRVPPQNPWQSPNLLLDQARIDDVTRRHAQGDPVIAPAFDQAVNEAQVHLLDVPDPVVGALKVPGFYQNQTAQQAIARKIRRDAVEAYSFAVAYALTKDPAYAAKAKEFVFAWVHNCTHPVDGGQPWQIITWDQRGDTPLVCYYTFPQFCGAVDLLKAGGQLTPAEVAQFEKWLRIFVLYCSQAELSINNHVDWQVVMLMSAGHILNDRALFDKAVRIYKNGFQFQVWGTGELPFEILRDDKAATYTVMAIEAMEQAIFFAQMHGYDLMHQRSIWGGDIRDAVGYLVSFMENPHAWDHVTGGRVLNGQGSQGEWGWVLESANMWWDDPRYARQLLQRPYGAYAPRVYTTSNATLDFAR